MNQRFRVTQLLNKICINAFFPPQQDGTKSQKADSLLQYSEISRCSFVRTQSILRRFDSSKRVMESNMYAAVGE